VNESCHVWLPHESVWCQYTCEWVMSCVTASWKCLVSIHMWMSHVMCDCLMKVSGVNTQVSHGTCEWVMPHENGSCHMWMSHSVCHCLMKASGVSIQVSHGTCGTHMNESWHIYEWVVAHMNELWRTYEWSMAHIWVSHGTYEWIMAHMNGSWHTYERVMAHIWTSHGICKSR